jgi:hypothetical protein
MMWMMQLQNFAKWSGSISRYLNGENLSVGAQWMIDNHNEEYLQQADFRSIFAIFRWESCSISRLTA